MKSDRDSRSTAYCTEELAFSQDRAQAIAGQLKALGHPVRLQILQHLGNARNCCCNDFCACIPLAQSTISQHLKILSNAGIIDYKPAGNCSHYSLNPDALEEAMQALAQVIGFAKDLSSSELTNLAGPPEVSRKSPNGPERHNRKQLNDPANR